MSRDCYQPVGITRTPDKSFLATTLGQVQTGRANLFREIAVASNQQT